MTSVVEYRQGFLKLQGVIEEKKKTLEELQQRKRNIVDDVDNANKATLVLQTCAKTVQDNLVYHISEIVTTALQTIFDETYSFSVEFDIKRGRTEVKFSLIIGEETHDKIISSVGGGVVDVISFSLRIALWNLARKYKKAGNLIVLDEPMKFLSRDKQEKASDIISLLSQKLGIQFLIVSHDDAFIDCSNLVYKTELVNGRTTKITKI